MYSWTLVLENFTSPDTCTHFLKLSLTRSSALAEAFLIFAKIGNELVTERMFTDMRHRFRVLKLTELSYLWMR